MKSILVHKMTFRRLGLNEVIEKGDLRNLPGAGLSTHRLQKTAIEKYMNMTSRTLGRYYRITSDTREIVGESNDSDKPERRLDIEL